MIYWLNLILNRFSMYRLLSIALASMWGFAIFLSLMGLLPYSPLALIVSGTVLVLAAYFFNLLFGWLFGVRTHDESSFISALILFFIFSPTIAIPELAALALVAMIAMATKFLLAVRGRHIFNPAASAAVIISLTGITFATWWVATPVLLPVTLLFAFLILYKTRRLRLGGIFLTIAIPLVLAGYLLNGQSAADALAALPSWPLLFFVGFMLSEPLTLPPRHWQQYAVGAIVAVLFAVPFHIGIISSSPALALVMGNIIAFCFKEKRHIQLTFKGRKQLTPSVYEYAFETNEPINFTAGQYMEITVPHPGKDGRGIRRIFSIVGIPDESTVRFGVKMYDHPSTFKQALATLPVDSAIDATGIGGDFVLPNDATVPLLFVAGGIGITPFISHILEMKRRNQTRDIVLVYAVADINDIAYVNQIETADIRTIVVTKTDNPMPVGSWIHHNNERFTKNDIKTYIPDIAMRHSYVSGPPTMVDSTKHILREADAAHIKSDYFTGY